MKLLHVVGARPNYMKIAPVMEAVAREGRHSQRLVHTGQHYDDAMSRAFFDDLELPEPDVFLGVGSGSHAEQTAKVMVAFERVCLDDRPDLVLVAGDVNSTMACAIDCAKLLVPCAHVEAGLRSFDPTMPEEINRIVTDHLCQLLLTPSPDGDENLKREGIPAERIHLVGNTMIDSLEKWLPKARARRPWERLGVAEGRYGLVTLHRPANVDDAASLALMVDLLEMAQQRLPLVFPVHPRTRRRLADTGLLARFEGLPRLVACEPLGYLDFLGIEAAALVALTDSGGVQEEATALQVPCLTLRPNTERPITITEGSNTLVGPDPAAVARELDRVLDGRGKKGRRPALWDGKAGERIAAVIAREAARGERARP